MQVAGRIVKIVDCLCPTIFLENHFDHAWENSKRKNSGQDFDAQNEHSGFPFIIDKKIGCHPDRQCHYINNEIEMCQGAKQGDCSGTKQMVPERMIRKVRFRLSIHQFVKQP